jgi:hypothetical protein
MRGIRPRACLRETHGTCRSRASASSCHIRFTETLLESAPLIANPSAFRAVFTRASFADTRHAPPRMSFTATTRRSEQAKRHSNPQPPPRHRCCLSMATPSLRLHRDRVNERGVPWILGSWPEDRKPFCTMRGTRSLLSRAADSLARSHRHRKAPARGCCAGATPRRRRPVPRAGPSTCRAVADALRRRAGRSVRRQARYSPNGRGRSGRSCFSPSRPDQTQNPTLEWMETRTRFVSRATASTTIRSSPRVTDCCCSLPHLPTPPRMTAYSRRMPSPASAP